MDVLKDENNYKTAFHGFSDSKLRENYITIKEIKTHSRNDHHWRIIERMIIIEEGKKFC